MQKLSEGAERRDQLEKQLELLQGQLDSFNDDILKLEEQCDTTIEMIHELRNELAFLP